jgi:hypothetical protein
MSTFGNPLTDYSPQMEAFEYPQFEDEFTPPVFSEAEEVELTAELLGVSNEQDMEQFLGSLISKAGKAIGGFVKSPIGKAIGGVLKSAAKVALPMATGALGTFLGGPVGTMIGSSLGSMAGKALGLELEGLSPEDRDFEVSRQFVRFAGDTVKNALQAPCNADPAAVAKAAATEAARVHAPGLLSSVPAATAAARIQTPGLSNSIPAAAKERGRWIRRDGAIILYGV